MANRIVDDFVQTPESVKSQANVLALLKKMRTEQPGVQKFAVVHPFINKIMSINDVAQTADIDFYLRINWLCDKYVGMSDDDFCDSKAWEEDDWWNRMSK